MSCLELQLWACGLYAFTLHSCFAFDLASDEVYDGSRKWLNAHSTDMLLRKVVEIASTFAVRVCCKLEDEAALNSKQSIQPAMLQCVFVYDADQHVLLLVKLYHPAGDPDLIVTPQRVHDKVVVVVLLQQEWEEKLLQRLILQGSPRFWYRSSGTHKDRHVRVDQSLRNSKHLCAVVRFL